MNKVAIIGGGFVGLQEAVLFAKRGYKVFIIDVNRAIIERINSKYVEHLHVKEKFVLDYWEVVKDRISADSDYRVLRDENIRNIIIAVNTPVKVVGDALIRLLDIKDRRVDNYIDFSTIENVVSNLVKYVQDEFYINSLVTIYPGGTRERILRYLLEAGFTLDKDFYLTHTPERVDPGSSKYNVSNLPRVIGAPSENSLKYGIHFYRNVGVNLVPVNKLEVAEMSKIFENAWRFMNIAFSQELFMGFDDAIKVIDASATKPFGFMKFYPGPYIGGSCLVKDTIMYYCITGSEIARKALIINEGFPRIYAERLYRIIKERNAKKLLFYGFGFKPGSPYYISKELNPVERVISELRRIDNELEVKRYDPNIQELSDFADEEEARKWADIVFYWENYQLVPR